MSLTDQRERERKGEKRRNPKRNTITSPPQIIPSQLNLLKIFSPGSRELARSIFNKKKESRVCRGATLRDGGQRERKKISLTDGA